MSANMNREQAAALAVLLAQHRYPAFTIESGRTFDLAGAARVVTLRDGADAEHDHIYALAIDGTPERLQGDGPGPDPEHDGPTFIMPVLYRVPATADPNAAWEAFTQTPPVQDARSVFCGGPYVDTGCETFDVDVYDTDDAPREHLRDAKAAEGARCAVCGAPVVDGKHDADMIGTAEAARLDGEHQAVTQETPPDEDPDGIPWGDDSRWGNVPVLGFARDRETGERPPDTVPLSEIADDGAFTDYNGDVAVKRCDGPAQGAAVIERDGVFASHDAGELVIPGRSRYPQ